MHDLHWTVENGGKPNDFTDMLIIFNVVYKLMDVKNEHSYIHIYITFNLNKLKCFNNKINKIFKCSTSILEVYIQNGNGNLYAREITRASRRVIIGLILT